MQCEAKRNMKMNHGYFGYLHVAGSVLCLGIVRFHKVSPQRGRGADAPSLDPEAGCSSDGNMYSTFWGKLG